MKTLTVLLIAIASLLSSSLLTGCVVHDRDGSHYRHHRDSDRDGVPDRHHRDSDRDGVPDRQDRRPGDPYRN